MENSLVMSNITQHDAAKLCEDPMSWGLDFVGPDGMYCDMGTHKLSPLCSSHPVDGCVNVDHDKKVVTKRSVGVKREAEKDFKSFENIQYFG